MKQPALPATVAAAGLSFPVMRAPEPARAATGASRLGPHHATLGEHATTVTVIETPPAWLIDLGAYGRYGYDTRAGAISVYRDAGSAELTRLALEGPVLAHALAHHGIHVLHASAIRRGEGPVVVLTATSGAGKSTFAAVAAGAGWTRVADDLLPWRVDDTGAPQTLPHLHQPKLTSAQQYADEAPPVLPVAAILHLARTAGPPKLAPIEGRAAIDLVIGATVGTRAYPRHALAGHLARAAAIARAAEAGQLRIATLTVRDRPDDPAAAVLEALDVLGLGIPL